MSVRHISAKKAWARISERAERGEKFGFIACLGILYKGGFLTRGEVLEQLNQARISRADLVKFREHIDHPQPGPVSKGTRAGEFSSAREQHAHPSTRNPGGPETRSSAHVLSLPVRA